MKENENWRKKLSSGVPSKLAEEFTEIGEEDMELYLFMRGGFAAK
ncbi:MAG: hypothetical protein SCH70_09840 [Candidatus Methanoperedens sp.]|nr:hypothetical protein [Candidatus Methanoperedens sp.]